ncbi:MAG TPA: HD domain-containing protein [Solirubrobacteraceae bacterium]|jgi:3'-5' exoribonuclease|nr:HD domain-containing protein [Solirubrobacteraceae bacterium]
MSSASARTVEQMEQDLRELIVTVQSPHLRALLERTLGPDAPTWLRFREAPAAKRYHHAYRHGLLDHSLTVAQAVSALSAIFGGVNRDLALTGALLHDIGKLDAYHRVGEEIEMSDAGRLHGEIALGYARVRDEIAAVDGFPPELSQALLHIILSHHGSLEHGSPVVPCTREATLVHMADNLGSKLGSFDRVERALDEGAQWGSYDNGIGAVAYFGVTGAEPQSARLAA